jgi:hypothetical protein
MINKFTKVLIISGDYVELHVTEEVKVSLPVKQVVGHAKVTHVSSSGNVLFVFQSNDRSTNGLTFRCESPFVKSGNHIMKVPNNVAASTCKTAAISINNVTFEDTSDEIIDFIEKARTKKKGLYSISELTMQ